MLGVLQGFAVIFGVIAAGYLAALFRVVKTAQLPTLNNVAFYIATPALLFSVLHDADPHVLLSPVVLVTTVAAVLSAGVFVVASRIWFRRDLASTTLGATSSAYLNSGNLGLPVAMYILGDAAYVAPLFLVQMLLFAPVVFSILETTRGGRGGALRAIGRAAASPIILASVVALAISLLRVPVPGFVLEPIELVGAAAVPLVLMSFGASLRGSRVLRPGTDRRSVVAAVAAKALVMPFAAWLLCLLLGLSPHQTFVALTIAALPTAQNIYNYAATYRRAETMVRDTILLTTFISVPVIAAIALLFGG